MISIVSCRSKWLESQLISYLSFWSAKSEACDLFSCLHPTHDINLLVGPCDWNHNWSNIMFLVCKGWVMQSAEEIAYVSKETAYLMLLQTRKTKCLIWSATIPITSVLADQIDNAPQLTRQSMRKENQSTDPEFWILETLSQGKGISPVV
jgi:hypothetical protein